ncbi:hypothetical protein Hanom_Chr02g00147841 [Helianthus anomalus]
MNSLNLPFQPFQTGKVSYSETTNIQKIKPHLGPCLLVPTPRSLMVHTSLPLTKKSYLRPYAQQSQFSNLKS